MNARSVRFLRLATVLGLGAASLAALASWEEIIDSVHFYEPGWGSDGKRLPVDFGRAPQQVMQPGWNIETRRASEIYGDTRFGVVSYDEDRNEAAWNLIRARNLEALGKYRSALQAYARSSADPAFKRDRIELLTSRHPEKQSGLQDYLRDTYVLQTRPGVNAKPALQRLKTLKCDTEVAAHVAYVVAWADTTEDGAALSHRYFSVYQRFPKSSRAQDALVMAARSLLQYRTNQPSTVEIAEARRDFQLLLTKYPQSRFREDAEGWLARCDRIEGHENKALNVYWTLAEHGLTPEIRWKVYESIAEICRDEKRFDREITTRLLQRSLDVAVRYHLATSKELRKRFSALSPSQAKSVQFSIRRDPRLLESYIAFRIEDTTLTRKQEAGLLTFAVTSLQKMHSPTPDLLARVAQISYNDGLYRTAKRYATMELTRGGTPDARARSRYVLAASLARLGKPQQAIRQYQTLSNSKAPDYFLQSCREHLALLEERYGDRVEALKLYERLKYDRDVSYMADVELSPAQLANYITAGARPAQKPTLIYTLGMRYFRLGLYSKAATTFRRLSQRQRLAYGLAANDLKDFLQYSLSFDQLPKQRDPLLSVLKLSHLQTIVTTSHGERRAEALYEMAAYMYQKRSLLFYSPGLWKGSRDFLISLSWSSLNNRDDDQNLDQYCHLHETYAHVMRLCAQVESMHLRTPVAVKALYTDGLASQRLANFDGWWRNQSGLMERAIHRMQTLARHFPHATLAKPAAKYAQVFAEQNQPNYQPSSN